MATSGQQPRAERNEAVVVLAAPEHPTGKAAGSFLGVAKVEIPEGSQLIAAVYGEVQVNPPGAGLDRVLTGIEWKAQFRTTAQSTAPSDAAPTPFPLTKENGGRLRWTRNDGWPLAKVIVP